MKYLKSHEWVIVKDNIGTVGISQYAQEQLGDIVYVELPKLNKEVKSGEDAAVVESVKSASDIYSPVSGTIIEVNETLNSQPELINSSPESEGWIFKVKLNQPSEYDSLLSKEEYLNTLQS